MRIVILGAGVQGTVFAVRLAKAGHQVTLISRSERAIELRQGGATIQDLKTMRISTKVLPILERLPSDLAADMCFVTVRREQIESVLPDLAGATSIPRVVFLMNHANGSDNPLTFFEPSRIVLAFPGMAGYRETSIIRYLDIPQQHTVVEERAQDVVSLFRDAGFAVEAVRDMDAWMISLSTPGRLSQSHCPAQANTEIEGAPAGAVTGVVV